MMNRIGWLTLLLSAFVLLECCGRSGSGSSYRVYVSNEASGDLTVIDPVTMAALTTVPLGNAREEFTREPTES